MGMRRRVFSKEFKLHVLREVQSGKTQAELARKYQILPKLICRWLGELDRYGDRAVGGLGSVYTDEARIAALERKVARLETENDLLKKALTQLDQARESGARSGECE